MVNIPCNVKGTGFVTSYSYQKDPSGKVILINVNLDQKYKDVIGDINKINQEKLLLVLNQDNL